MLSAAAHPGRLRGRDGRRRARARSPPAGPTTGRPTRHGRAARARRGRPVPVVCDRAGARLGGRDRLGRGDGRPRVDDARRGRRPRPGRAPRRRLRRVHRRVRARVAGRARASSRRSTAARSATPRCTWSPCRPPPSSPSCRSGDPGLAAVRPAARGGGRQGSTSRARRAAAGGRVRRWRWLSISSPLVRCDRGIRCRRPCETHRAHADEFLRRGRSIFTSDECCGDISDGPGG